MKERLGEQEAAEAARDQAEANCATLREEGRALAEQSVGAREEIARLEGEKAEVEEVKGR